jgi:hypothetical protein
MPVDSRRSLRSGRLVTNKRSILGLLDELSGDYAVVVLDATLVVLCSLLLIDFVRERASIVRIGMAFVSLAVLLLFFWSTVRTIKRNSMLDRLETGLDRDLNRAVVLRAIASLRWTLVYDYKTYAIALTEATGFTWGQEVTIIFDDQAVFVNCRNRDTPGASVRSPWLFGNRTACVNRLGHEIDRLKAANTLVTGRDSE